MVRRIAISLIGLLFGCALAARSAQPVQSPPVRDTPAQKNAPPPPPMGRLTGRVLAANNGRPIKRARAYVIAPELPEGRGTLTDDSGVFELTELPAGRYTLTVSKPGFISLSYGQRRPLQTGTPLQLGDGQQMAGIEFRLPRGSVLAGHVFDETGDAMPGVAIRVMRYQYAQGERQLLVVSAAQTDDQGAFRVWGLNPGDYYVSAVTSNFDFGPVGRGGPGGGFGGRGIGGERGGTAGGRAADPSADDETVKAYAPTYYPGVGSIGEARPVRLAVGQELLGLDFNVLLVRAARVTGLVTNSDGTPTSTGQVNLMSEGSSARGRDQPGADFGSRIEWDGRFAIANVPPGRYMLRVRGDDFETPQYAAQPLTVTSVDVSDADVLLYPSASINGTVSFEGTPAPEPNQIRITAPWAENALVAGNPNARVEKDGTFTLAGVPAGLHWIRSGGNLRGWSLKSVIVDSHDVADTPIEVRSGEVLNNVNVVFTNRQTEINGTVTDDRGNPLTDFTVLAFPSDPSLWRPLARQIMTARADQSGKFQIRGLPSGAYYLATIDPAEQGEWFEPAFLDQQRLTAARVTLSDGDTKTHDFHISAR
jgi:Carboxypeptidase regulatory-like domain